MTRDAGIIGAGPAGIAAAVQLARHGVRPTVFEKGTAGGLLRTAWCVENFPGFRDGISGPDLVSLLGEQLRASEAELILEEVTSLDREEGRFVCRTSKRAFRFRAVIVASGTRPRAVPDLEIPADAAERVFREVSELWSVRDAHIVVIGGGDAAFDYALGLSEENDVTILVRGTSTCCLPLLASRVCSRERVAVRTATRLTGVARAAGGCLRLMSLSAGADGGGDPVGLDADYLVLAVGRDPEDSFLSAELRRTAPALESTELRRTAPALESAELRRTAPALEAPGELLFAGDVRSGIFRQASIAAGQGTHAAMRAAAMLRERDRAAVACAGENGADSQGERR